MSEEMLACPWCRARINENCTDMVGLPIRHHWARLALMWLRRRGWFRE